MVLWYDLSTPMLFQLVPEFDVCGCMLFTNNVLLYNAEVAPMDVPFCQTEPFTIELVVQPLEANNLFEPLYG